MSNILKFPILYKKVTKNIILLQILLVWFTAQKEINGFYQNKRDLWQQQNYIIYESEISYKVPSEN